MILKMSSHHSAFPFLILFLLLQFLFSSAQIRYPCEHPDHDSYDFCDTSLSIATRARSLISHLTLPEKVQQLCNNVTPISRLGLPAYEWWSESLHGIASNGPGISYNGSIALTTLFPQVILTAAAFNRTLWFQVASAIAVEARAMYNVGQSGLTFWAPNINVFRDPRWGRGQETPGEDPMVASAYSIEYVKGFQGENWGGGGRNVESEKKRELRSDAAASGGLMLSACCKHYTAYDLESWGSYSRYSFNAVVSKQDMEDTFQPPFRSCIQQGKASCLMCSYNSVNGIPACARGDLLQKARNEWGFNGYVTSDCDAVATVYEYQHYVNSSEDAVADVLKAGVDINCGTYMLRNTKSAIEQGKVQEEDIDRALFNLFSVQLRLGLYDGNPEIGRYGKLGADNVCTKEHKKLALEAARQGIVLLKNDKKLLPLNKNSVVSLAVIGPMANDVSRLGGGYSGIPCNPVSLLMGLGAYVKESFYAAGCANVPCYSGDGFEEAVDIAKEADYVIVVVGLDLSQETEDHDRVSLLLPGRQTALVSAVAAISKKPLILVLTGGGPVDVSFAQGDSQIGSIFWIGYPGEAGGTALAEIIFGDYNPGGRLPVTWYPESFMRIPMNDMSMRSDPARGYPGRTYRFYTGDRLYGFGEGMSYTSYNYKFVSAPKQINLLESSEARSRKYLLQQRIDNFGFIHVDELGTCDSLRFYVQISVTNDGSMDGSHVLLLFATPPKVFSGTPEKQLVGFSRVHVSSFNSSEESILVDPCNHFSFANELGRRILTLGDHLLFIGNVKHFISVQI